jgi:ribosomal protein S10
MFKKILNNSNTTKLWEQGNSPFENNKKSLQKQKKTTSQKQKKETFENTVLPSLKIADTQDKLNSSIFRFALKQPLQQKQREKTFENIVLPPLKNTRTEETSNSIYKLKPQLPREPKNSNPPPNPRRHRDIKREL